MLLLREGYPGPLLTIKCDEREEITVVVFAALYFYKWRVPFPMLLSAHLWLQVVAAIHLYRFQVGYEQKVPALVFLILQRNYA